MTPYCLKLGFNEKMPKYSIVGLYCDFNNDNLRNLGLNNINQLTKIVSPQTEIIIVANNISDTFMLELKKIKDINKLEEYSKCSICKSCTNVIRL